jgi:hypothetical protein
MKPGSLLRGWIVVMILVCLCGTGWGRPILPYKPIEGCVRQGKLVARLKGYNYRTGKWEERLCRSAAQYEAKGGTQPLDLTPYEGKRIQVWGHGDANRGVVTVDVYRHRIRVLGPCP